MADKIIVKCPKCDEEFSIDDVLVGQLENKIKTGLEIEIRGKAEKEFDKNLNILKEEIEAKDKKLFENAAAIPNTAEEAAKHPIFELVDEVEVVNGGNIEKENRFAQEVTRVLGLSGTGGSDAHSVQGLGKGATMFRGDIRNELDLLEALRAGEFVPVEGFHVGHPTYYGGNSNGGGSPWSTST